jgi:hypothetical protein
MRGYLVQKRCPVDGTHKPHPWPKDDPDEDARWWCDGLRPYWPRGWLTPESAAKAAGFMREDEEDPLPCLRHDVEVVDGVEIRCRRCGETRPVD